MSKRRGDSSSSNRERQACRNSGKKAFEEESGSLIDYSEGAWSGLSQEVISNLSETIVSVASFNGDQMHFSGTGIVVRNKDEVITSILTSANVIRCFDDDSKVNPFLEIQVLLPNKQRVIGWMGPYDLNYNIAVVVIKYLPGLRAASFDHEVRLGSQSKVVAVGRSFNSGKLMALSGIVIDEPTDYPEHLMISTCKSTKAMAGGPLIDLDGNFVGMNFFSEERTPFLPRNKIYRSLVRSCTLWVEIDDECTNIIERCRSEKICNNFVGSSSGEAENKNEELTISFTSDSEDTLDEENESEAQKLPESSTSDSEEFLEELLFPKLIQPLPDDEFTLLVRKDLKSRNYPMPIRFWGGTFEEEFAEDTWCKLSKKVASNTSRSVVSLASFKGEERFFCLHRCIYRLQWIHIKSCDFSKFG